MTVDIDWNNLGFGILKTKSFIQFAWRDGEWDSGLLVSALLGSALGLFQFLAIHFISNIISILFGTISILFGTYSSP